MRVTIIPHRKKFGLSPDFSFSLIFLGLISLVFAYSPSITKNLLDFHPRTFLYFEDSRNLLYLDENSKQLRRSADDGKTWECINFKNSDPISALYSHPTDNNVAYAVTEGKTHFVTEDKGASWRVIETPLKPVPRRPPFVLHATNSKYVLYAGIDCSETDYLNLKCIPNYFYTENNFQSKPKKLVSAHQCVFTKSNREFTNGDDKLVFCALNSEFEPGNNNPENRRLMCSSDWFNNKSYAMLDGLNVRGITDLGVASKFLYAVSESHRDNCVSLLVSLDGITWDNAEFFGRQKKDFSNYKITVLESSTHSLHVDIFKQGSDLGGEFYTSNSNGTYFTKSLSHVNHNSEGVVDMEKLENIEGILIANVISNHDEAKSRSSLKQIRTKVSYNDGRTWSYISVDDGSCKGDDECGLNLHSVADNKNVGRIFSSPAIGVIAGVGNTGKYLTDYKDGDLYVSHNSALSWFRSRHGAHKYEFGDSGNIIAAIDEKDATNSMIYSVDRGVTWNSYDLGTNIRPSFLFTTQGPTSTKFVLMGEPRDARNKYAIYNLDFSNLFSRKCVLKKDNTADFEKWYAIWEDRNNPACMMGHKQFFYRRKPNADCFVGDVYNEQKPQSDPCLCTIHDFECDYNFVRQWDKTCKASSSFVEDTGDCNVDSNAVFTGKSGYVLIPGNDCVRQGGTALDGPVWKNCDGTFADPDRVRKPSRPGTKTDASKPINAITNNFGGKIVDYVYLKADDPATADETILLKTDQNKVYVTHDHGATWKLATEDKEVLSIYVNTYHPNRAYLITTKEEVLYTTDRAQTWSLFRTPASRNNMGMPYLTFSKTDADWLIWTGEIGCDNQYSPTCHSATYYTRNNGDRWNLLQENVKQCKFFNDLQYSVSDRLIFCERLYTAENGQTKSQLLSSTNFFETHNTLYNDIIGYALEHEFVVVATVNGDGKSLDAFVSVDGKNFANVKFPANFKIGKQQAYTILESITHSIFMHVTVNSRPGSEYGTILKSNSNGTNYVTSLDFVDRNAAGYVDFEKIMGLEGVAIVNVVKNPSEAFQGSKKKLKSMITHNDGGEWSYISPPYKDSEGKRFNCPGSSLELCSLNLHGYTERADYRDTFSSQSAVGMMLAVGNVGEYLTPLHDGNTYFTNNGGVSWKEIKKGSYMWEFGDQGSIIVIVNGRDNTNVVYYTIDEGETWNEYKFSEEMVRIEDIATVPSDSSQKFLLVGRPPLSRGEASLTIQLDFSNLFSRKCVLDESNPNNDDFELWTPSHPSQSDNCLFGHESQYYRKIKARECYIGHGLLEPHRIVRNCTCGRQDYECDFNYMKGPDGSCHLVPGYSPPDHSVVCTEMPGTVEYWVPTGYRRIPLSTCQGGQEFDKVEAKPCPGKEKDFKDKHRGLHGFGLFMVIVFSIGMAAVIIFVMYDHFTSQYGKIRLGDSDDDVNLFVKYLVISVSAVIAFVTILTDLAKSGVRYLQSKLRRSSRFTVGRSLVRPRNGDYIVVPANHAELLEEETENYADEEETGNQA